MKKIAYIELDTHAEIAVNFMELMQDSKDFHVDYYFHEKVFKLIEKREPNILLTESSEILTQLQNNNYDLIIIGTVHRYFNIFKEICKKYNTSVIVHNVNFTKISKLQLFKNIFKKDFKYRLKLLLKEDLFSAPEVFTNAKNLLVLDENLAKNTMKFLPVFFNEYNENIKSEIFIIVIPGAVSQERRDYFNLIESFRDLEIKLKNGDLKIENKLVEIVFLGKAKEKELVWLKDLEKSLEYINLIYFTEKVPQNIFDEWMQKADVLWCPVQKETEFFSNKEFYGKTKMSGNIGDAIKYGKTVIFSKNYPNTFPFIISEIDGIEEQFLSIKMQKKYNFQEEFNKEKIQKKLEETLEKLF